MLGIFLVVAYGLGYNLLGSDFSEAKAQIFQTQRVAFKETLKQPLCLQLALRGALCLQLARFGVGCLHLARLVFATGSSRGFSRLTQCRTYYAGRLMQHAGLAGSAAAAPFLKSSCPLY